MATIPDWVHCNWCKAASSSARSGRYFVTSCQHVLCELCSSNTASTSDGRTICIVCTQVANLTEINRSMPADLRMLFDEPAEIAGKLKRYFNTVNAVTTFQKEQRNRMQKLAQARKKRMIDSTKSEPKVDEELLALRSKARNIDTELQVTRAEVNALKRENHGQRLHATRSASAKFRRVRSPTPTSGSSFRARARTSISNRSRSMPRGRSVVEENDEFDSLGNSYLTSSSSSSDVLKTPTWR